MKAHIIYHGAVSLVGVNQVESLCIELRDCISTLTLNISTSGGDVGAGIGLYNFLVGMPFRVDTHNFGLCDSIGVNVFLAGQDRTYSRVSRFGLHAAKTPDGRVAKPDTDMMTKPFAEGLKWSEDLLSRYFSSTDDKLLTSEEAEKLGIATGLKAFSIENDSLLLRVDPEGKAPVDLAIVRAAAAGARARGPS